VFSNALPPVVTAGNLLALELAAIANGARARLAANTDLFRSVSRTLCVPVVSRLFGRGVAVCGCRPVVRTSG
jgi:7-keto-8-aminopelargonate synthetase-like enzyme